MQKFVIILGEPNGLSGMTSGLSLTDNVLNVGQVHPFLNHRFYFGSEIGRGGIPFDLRNTVKMTLYSYLLIHFNPNSRHQ